MKLFKLLIKIFLLVVVVVGVAIGVVVYQISDNNFSEPDYLSQVEPVKLDFNDVVSKGLKDTKETGKMSFGFSERDINSALKSFKDDANKKLIGAEIKTMYIMALENNDIVFKTYIDFGKFMTSLTGDFHMDLVDYNLCISVKDLKIGKLEFEKNVVSSLINKVTNGQSLMNNFEIAGLKLSSNLDELSLSLDVNNFKDGLLESIKHDNDSNLYQTMLNILFRAEDVIGLNKEEHNIGIDFNLEPFAYNEQTDVASPYNINFEDVNEKVEQLWDANIANKENSNDIASFLVKGNNLDENILSKVNNLDFSSVGIDDNSTYEGIVEFDEKEIGDIFSSQIPTSLEGLASFEGFKFSESDWNNIFLKSGAIGQVYTFVREENGKHESSYIAVESLYMDIIDDHFAIYLKISLNGKSLVLNFELDSNDAEGLYIASTLKSMRFGGEILSDEEVKSLLSFMDTAIEDEWIMIDSENKTMNFDFGHVFDGNEQLKTFIESSSATANTSFVYNEGNGYTLINLEY